MLENPAVFDLMEFASFSFLSIENCIRKLIETLTLMRNISELRIPDTLTLLVYEKRSSDAKWLLFTGMPIDTSKSVRAGHSTIKSWSQSLPVLTHCLSVVCPSALPAALAPTDARSAYDRYANACAPRSCCRRHAVVTVVL